MPTNWLDAATSAWCRTTPVSATIVFDFATDGAAYESGTMKGIWNHIRAVDLLESLPEVDPDRIGVIGHSLGGHNALFVAAFDQRIRAVVSSCGFNAFEDYYDRRPDRLVQCSLHARDPRAVRVRPVADAV